MKSNVYDKLPGSNNEEITIIFEQVPDFETLHITLNAKNLKMLVYKILVEEMKK